jgi:23S rRNA pseudouridine1911/1915/1917 synthase
MRILYMDKWLLLCEKPVGVLSESSEGDDNMPAMLTRELTARGERGEVYPVHRLDRAVGGLMVFARDSATAGKLSALIAERKMTKQYLCLVHGAPAASEGELRDLLFKDSTRNKTFVVKRMRRGVKEAYLNYRALAPAAPTPWGDCSPILVTMGTGRSHQIRVQFSTRGMPLLGDGKYGGSDNGTDVALFSHRIAFAHPRTGKTVDVSLTPTGMPWELFTNALPGEACHE